ncbi:hypothetical protein L596_024809 [Steinernema carpocapsae]|uniref:Uncharacterized protein n=1 Tax=Steinernema carpocapsae TaxID=34508 RepID=A0A4U5M5V4_STECR|nr:hypothetical protein L596_024809 [Steinernema carpocapsae]
MHPEVLAKDRLKSGTFLQILVCKRQKWLRPSTVLLFWALKNGVVVYFPKISFMLSSGNGPHSSSARHFLVLSEMFEIAHNTWLVCALLREFLQEKVRFLEYCELTCLSDG